MGDVLVGKSVIGDSVAGLKVGPSLGIRVDGFVDGFCDGRFVVVIKESVTINVGSLLIEIRGSDVDESLGFGVGTSLLGSSVVGESVGFDEGLIVGDKLGDAVTKFKVGLSLGVAEIGLVVGFGVGSFVIGLNVGSLLVGDNDVGE